MKKESKEDIIGKAYQLGLKYENTYHGCGQTTLAAVQDALGLINNDVFKAATGFAGGFGRSGIGICGVLTAGVLMISYIFGRSRENFRDPERKRAKVYELIMKLIHKFLNEYGSIYCRDIQKKITGKSYNLWDTREYEEFHNLNVSPKTVAKAAKWITEIILEEMEKMV